MAHLELRASHAARLNRLLSILQRLKWEQGEDGLVRPVSPAGALNDLGLYMLGHEIDMAVERKETQAVPVLPEGWKLVPAEMTKAMKETVRENGGGQAMIYALAAWGDLPSAPPAAPLRTEAEVRAEVFAEIAEAFDLRLTQLSGVGAFKAFQTDLPEPISDRIDEHARFIFDRWDLKVTLRAANRFRKNFGLPEFASIEDAKADTSNFHHTFQIALDEILEEHPLRPEAAVRAEARSEALEEAAKVTEVAYLALIEKEPQ
jgi:hypothetical protein